MIALRVLALLAAITIIGCIVGYLSTRDRRWLGRAYNAFKWSLFAALGIFAVIIAQRLLGPDPSAGDDHKGSWPAPTSEHEAPPLVGTPGRG